jgi:RNA polymerase sigma factor (sigma-70 family)
MDDARLLIDFVATGSQSAFAQIVSRHVDLVYATAYRHVRNVQLAEDITQAVFLLLARKANSLRNETVLAAWLLRATRYASLDAIKLRDRRRRHENEAAQMNASATPSACPSTDASNAELLGLLDAAMARLSDADRRVLVLRYYEKRSFPEIGAVLGTGEESARKRVNRSVERLRGIFARRGSLIATGSTVAVVSAALGDCADAAPAGLAARAGSTVGEGGFSGHIAAAVARRMFFHQLRLIIVAASAGLATCILAGVLVHSLLVHHDRPPGPLPPVAEDHDHPG